VATLIKRYNAPASEVDGNTVPIAGVGAQAVKKKHGCVGTSAPFRSLPFDVMKTDAVSLEPPVGRFRHRL
jgi:hypothetical protein